MQGVVGEVAGKKLYDAAANGNVTTFQELLQEDPYLLDIVSFACSRNLLHMSTMWGQVGIVYEILKRNPRLARDLDSQKSSPLHFAAAEGHVEITSMLLSRAPEMCWTRDCQGMNPIHIAAMKGHAETLKILIQSDPSPAKETVDRGQTALHLCVKHRQLWALEVLVENLGELVGAEDEDGETVLHLAVRYQQVEMVRYLVENRKIDIKSRNSKGKEALYILMESQSHTDINSYLEMKNILLGRFTLIKAPHEILRKLSDSTMVVVVLIATMAFQAAVSPPGGVWQDDTSLHKAGEAVMASNRPRIYKNFVGANTTAFVSSIITIFLLTTGLPSSEALLTSAVFCTMMVSLASIAVSYGASIMAITPEMETRSLNLVIGIVVAVSVSLGGLGYVIVNFWVIRSWIKDIIYVMYYLRKK
ncbi:hypothetical protein C2S52_010051 [Perilla frutescens var. hirtella]|nr:hypothetical protein C2S52_010051 [Perilla frutescens var. hirtella]